MRELFAAELGRRGLALDVGDRLSLPPLQAAAPGAPLDGTAIATAGGLQQWVYRTPGEAAPSVLLHSAIGHAATWAGVQRRLLDAGRPSLAPDRRGHGRTTAAEDSVQVSEADDIVDLLEVCGLSGVHMVGSAQGARIALQVTLAAPERVASLTLVGSLAGQLALHGQELLPPGYSELPDSFRELGPAYRHVDPAGVAHWEALVSAHPALRRPAPRGTPAALEEVSVPVLFMTGDADPYAPTTFFRELAGRVQRGAVAIVPESGHSAPWERPQAVADTLAAFWATVESL